MTCEEALNTCEMALKAIGMSHSPQNDYNSVAEVTKEMSKEHDIETLMMCVERQIPKKPTPDKDFHNLKLCPTCNECLDVNGVNHFPHCANCGQKIDWSN